MDVENGAFWIADKGKGRVFWVKRNALHNFSILEVITTGRPEGIAVSFHRFITSVEAKHETVTPADFSLFQNYPNPFAFSSLLEE